MFACRDMLPGQLRLMAPRRHVNRSTRVTQLTRHIRVTDREDSSYPHLDANETATYWYCYCPFAWHPKCQTHCRQKRASIPRTPVPRHALGKRRWGVPVPPNLKRPLSDPSIRAGAAKAAVWLANNRAGSQAIYPAKKIATLAAAQSQSASSNGSPSSAVGPPSAPAGRAGHPPLSLCRHAPCWRATPMCVLSASPFLGRPTAWIGEGGLRHRHPLLLGLALLPQNARGAQLAVRPRPKPASSR